MWTSGTQRITFVASSVRVVIVLVPAFDSQLPPRQHHFDPPDSKLPLACCFALALPEVPQSASHDASCAMIRRFDCGVTRAPAGRVQSQRRRRRREGTRPPNGQSTVRRWRVRATPFRPDACRSEWGSRMPTTNPLDQTRGDDAPSRRSPRSTSYLHSHSGTPIRVPVDAGNPPGSGTDCSGQGSHFQ